MTEPGIYRHFKGEHYYLLNTVLHTETEETLAVYVAMYGDYKWFARPLTMFEGVDETSGKKRFEKVEPPPASLLASLDKIYNDLLKNSKDLPPDFKEVLYKNMSDLYLLTEKAA